MVRIVVASSPFCGEHDDVFHLYRFRTSICNSAILVCVLGGWFSLLDPFERLPYADFSRAVTSAYPSDYRSGPRSKYAPFIEVLNCLRRPGRPCGVIVNVSNWALDQTVTQHREIYLIV
jgi:hypothetical protein